MIRCLPSSLSWRFLRGPPDFFVALDADPCDDVPADPDTSRSAEIARSMAVRCFSSSEMMRLMSFNCSPLSRGNHNPVLITSSQQMRLQAKGLTIYLLLNCK